MRRIHFTFNPGRVGRACFLPALGIAFGVTVLPALRCAQAAETTRVVTAGDEDNPYDLNLSLAFTHEVQSGRLMRENITGTGAVEVIPDQMFRQKRDLLNLRMDVGLLPDVGLFLSLPIVISDTRTLSFDTECGSGACPSEATSQFAQDKIVPGLGSAFGLEQGQTFSGPKRQGIGYLGFGFNWAMFNQKRVASEPTWLLGFEARVDVSQTMRFDPKTPKANTAVGLGYHQLLANTVASKRFGALEPYIGGWYMFPIKTASSPFEKQGLGANAFAGPQQRAFVMAGVEATVWSKPEAKQSISLELRGSVEARFLGLQRSAMWEPLAGSSSCAGTPATGCRPGLDDRDLDSDGKPDPNTGITRSPTYGIFGGDVGLNVRTGEHVRFRGLFGVTAEQNRFLTDGGSGYATLDTPGRRFYVKDAFGYQFLIDGALVF